MITLEQYFRGRPHTEDQAAHAADLMQRVNPLMVRYTAETGKEILPHPHTGTFIAPAASKDFDEISGQTEGGFRLPDCPQGSMHSSHKILDNKGAGVDIHDPDDAFDDWLTDDILEEFGLYREHPDSTHGWVHLTNRAPGSGHRTFYP